MLLPVEGESMNIQAKEACIQKEAYNNSLLQMEK